MMKKTGGLVKEKREKEDRHNFRYSQFLHVNSSYWSQKALYYHSGVLMIVLLYWLSRWVVGRVFQTDGCEVLNYSSGYNRRYLVSLNISK